MSTTGNLKSCFTRAYFTDTKFGNTFFTRVRVAYRAQRQPSTVIFHSKANQLSCAPKTALQPLPRAFLFFLLVPLTSSSPGLLFLFGQPGSICCDNTPWLYLHTIMQLYFIRVYNSSSLAASGVGWAGYRACRSAISSLRYKS